MSVTIACRGREEGWALNAVVPRIPTRSAYGGGHPINIVLKYNSGWEQAVPSNQRILRELAPVIHNSVCATGPENTLRAHLKRLYLLT